MAPIPNTKINLIRQSDQYLSGATIMSPIGLQMEDISELVGDLADLSESISSEEIRAMGVEGKLGTQMESNKVAAESAISDEAATARAAEGVLTDALSAQSSKQVADDATMKSNLDAEAFTARAAEKVNKDAIDAILSSSSLSADTFVEIMNIFSSIDASQDADLLAFTTLYASEKLEIAGFNLAARTSMRSELDGKDSEITNALSAEAVTARAAEAGLTTNLNAEIERAKSAEDVLTINLNAEIERAEGAESLLDGRILDVINNTEPGEIDSVREAVESFNDILTENFEYLYSQKISGELFDTMGKGYGILDFYPSDTFMSGSDMVVVNGLIQSEGSDYQIFKNDILGSDYQGSVGIRFQGDALTLVKNGAPVIFYGTPDSISYVNISPSVKTIGDLSGK